jgi:hypothetical protein
MKIMQLSIACPLPPLRGRGLGVVENPIAPPLGITISPTHGLNYWSPLCWGMKCLQSTDVSPPITPPFLVRGVKGQTIIYSCISGSDFRHVQLKPCRGMGVGKLVWPSRTNMQYCTLLDVWWQENMVKSVSHSVLELKWNLKLAHLSFKLASVCSAMDV